MNKDLEKPVELFRPDILEMDLGEISPLWEETRERFIATFGELQTAIMLHLVLPDHILRR